MNKLMLVSVPLAIVAAAACALPWYLGLQAEQAMRLELSAMSRRAQFPLNVAFMRYDRGWLSSTAVTRVALKGHPSVYLDVRHEISQVPTPGVGWLHIRSEPQFNGAIKPIIEHYFAGRPAIAVDSVVAFDGTRKTFFRSPSFSEPVHGAPGMKLTWGGLEGTISVEQGERVVASASAPGLALEGGDTQAGLKNLQFDANWEMLGSAADWQGDTRIKLGELHFSGPHDHVAMKELSGAAYQRNKGDNVMLGYEVKVGAGSSAKVGEGENSFSNAVLNVEVDQIDKKVLTRYLDPGANGQPPAPTQSEPESFLALAADLLRGSPVLRIKELGVETPSGAISAHATVSFDGSNLRDVSFYPDMLTRVRAKGDVAIAASLLRSQLQRNLRPQVEMALVQQGAQGTEENIKSVSEKFTDAELKSLTDSGILRASGSNFTVEAEVVGGQVLLNGKSVSELFATMLTPPSATPRSSSSPRIDLRAGIPSRPVALAQGGTQ